MKFPIFIISTLLIVGCSSIQKNDRSVSSVEGSGFKLQLISEKPNSRGNFLVLTPVRKDRFLEVSYNIPEGYEPPGYPLSKIRSDVFIQSCLVENVLKSDGTDGADAVYKIRLSPYRVLTVGGPPIPGMKSAYLLETTINEKTSYDYMLPTRIDYKSKGLDVPSTNLRCDLGEPKDTLAIP